VSRRGARAPGACPFGDAATVVTREPIPGRPHPAFALGFVIEREQATRAVTQWIRRRERAPLGLRRAAAERMTRIYPPSYLYSATADSQYQASIGENYRQLGLAGGEDGGIVL